jgi:site-specific recombinase XerD
MKLADAAEYYEFSSLTKSPATQRWITARMSYFVQWCVSQGVVELPDLKPLHIQKYLDRLARGEYAVSGKALSSYTVNGHGRIIRAWLNWCVKNPDVRDELKPHLPKSLNLPKVRIKVIEHFTTDQLDRLLAACRGASTVYPRRSDGNCDPPEAR